MRSLCIAHFGHPQLKGAWHWALVLLDNAEGLKGVAYQISGSTTNYQLMDPQVIDLAEESAYQGKQEVGRLSDDFEIPVFEEQFNLQSLPGMTRPGIVRIGSRRLLKSFTSLAFSSIAGS